ncbi:ester cyclase [Rhizobium jaguaris]|uniref:ester cyclase n=1 Tax=Rhizobium jaguaris TaxID=1312183 RepID=UPI0039BF0DE7
MDSRGTDAGRHGPAPSALRAFNAAAAWLHAHAHRYGSGSTRRSLGRCVYYTMTDTHEGAFMGIAPTGNRVKVPGIGIYEVRDGMIVESWVVRDSLVLLRQLGADVTVKSA